MKKRSPPTSKKVLVYVHGTNGSGKSTLARALVAACGGVLDIHSLPQHKKALYTTTANGTVFIGKYGTACGGVDGLSPYAAIRDIVAGQAAQPQCVLFAEGLITPGIDTCQTLAGHVDEALFIHLDTPVDVCIANVHKRRARKGTTKPYDPANLLRKRDSSASWVNRIRGAGLDVRTYPSWIEAYLGCLAALGVPVPDASKLL